MTKTKEPTITDSREEDFTAITFYPDLEKFKMESLDKDTVDLFTRRAYDIAAATKGVKVFLNGKKLPVSFCKKAQIHQFSFYFVAAIAEWLRTLIFSALNGSSHRSGFKPSLGSM